MDPKMNGVKISIKNEGDDDRGQEKAKSKKKIIQEKKTVEKKEPPKKTKNQKIKKTNGTWSSIVSIFVTALIVGGGIYAWQKYEVKQMIFDFKKDAIEQKMEMEDRINRLKNQVTGVETENVELKEKNKELVGKAELLEGAKKEFDINELGLSFSYPAKQGNIVWTITDGVSGKKFKAEFSNNNKLTFGAVTEDFSREQSTSTVYKFTETRGYKEEDDKYYFLPIGESEGLEFTPKEIIKEDNNIIVLVDKNSFVIDPEGDGLSIDIGDSLGALINLDRNDFTGMGFVNADFEAMTVDSFKEMLKSILFN